MAQKAADLVVVPQVIHLPVKEGLEKLKKQQIAYQLIGAGELIYDQIPKAGTAINRGTKVVLYLDEGSKFSAVATKVVVPELQGLSNIKGEQILNELGLKLQAEGSGVIMQQIPAAGAIVDFGSVVRVKLKQLEN
jgi:stage V sporulation protein D (sporulation-specific penicillin-binding protein)